MKKIFAAFVILSVGCSEQVAPGRVEFNRGEVLNIGSTSQVHQEYAPTVRESSRPSVSTPTKEVQKSDSSKPEVRNPPNAEENDCVGLINGPELVDTHKAKLNGKYGAGQMLGSEFMPVLYFHTKSAAMKCVGNSMSIRKWTGNRWVQP